MKVFTRIATASIAAAFAFAAGAQEKPEGFTCCNLHYDQDWISDANWTSSAMIPAGTPIKVIDYGSNRARVEIDGKAMRLGHDYGRSQESLERWVAKQVMKDNPRTKIARYPEKVRTAIHNGKVIPGMTREQVVIAVGHPPTHRTPSLESSVWHHWASRAGRFEVHFNEKGAVEKIVGQQ